MNNISYITRYTFRQEPDCYDGKTCDKLRPRWMTSYPKEGDEEYGELLHIDLDARMMPPGTKVIIQIPVCPECGDPADMLTPNKRRRKWCNCGCGFSWAKWAEQKYS